MSYIDGYLIPVPHAAKQRYLEIAREMSKLFREHGAIRVVECWSDDVPKGKLTDFWMAVKAKEDEAVVFSWIEWPSKESRDAAMPKVMADPRMATPPSDMPFDGKRMIFGGFTAILDSDDA